MFTTAPLFGKFHSPLHPALRRVRAQPLHDWEARLADRVPAALLAPSHPGRRQRDYPPKLTLLAHLDQTLNDASCRSAVRPIQAYHLRQPLPRQLAEGTSSYCAARARWTLPELTAIRRHLADPIAHDPLNLGGRSRPSCWWMAPA